MFTVVITVAGGFLERLLDHQEYPTIGKGLWFALQTVTTVGYGDVTPKQASGRFIATVVMLTGIGFLAVVTASVTASLVESSRRRFAAQSEADDTRQFTEISDRLARIEAALEQQASGRSPDAAADEPGSITAEMSDEPPDSAPRERGAGPTEPHPTHVLRVT